MASIQIPSLQTIRPIDSAIFLLCSLTGLTSLLWLCGCVLRLAELGYSKMADGCAAEESSPPMVTAPPARVGAAAEEIAVLPSPWETKTAMANGRIVCGAIGSMLVSMEQTAAIVTPKPRRAYTTSREGVQGDQGVQGQEPLVVAWLVGCCRVALSWIILMACPDVSI